MAAFEHDMQTSFAQTTLAELDAIRLRLEKIEAALGLEDL
jgi:hypothetical protein